MMRLQDVRFTYPSAEKPALNDVTLEIEPLSWTVISGPDGSGKTTLSRLLKGLLTPDSGTITLAEDPATSVGYVGGDPYDWLIGLTVEEDVAFGLESQQLSAEEMCTRVAQAVERTGLSGMEKRLTHTLSGGEQQKVALAGILALGCRVVILDEALNMIDLPTRRSIRRMIAGLRSDLGLTVVEVTNRLAEALSGDRIVFLAEGSIRFDGLPHDILPTRMGRDWLEAASGMEGFSGALFQRGLLPVFQVEPVHVTSALLKLLSGKLTISEK
jgi:energy-coupling factor transport system ATP-binding protein